MKLSSIPYSLRAFNALRMHCEHFKMLDYSLVTSQKVKVNLNSWNTLMGQRDSLNKGIQPFPSRPNAHQLRALEAGVKRVPLPHIIDS